MENIPQLSPFVWLAVGIFFTALEIVVPGFFLFWFGISGILTALFVWIGIFNSAFSQWIFFFAASLFFLAAWRLFFKKFFRGRENDDYRDPTLANLRGRVTKTIEVGKLGEIELYTGFHGIKIWPAEADEKIDIDVDVKVVEADGIRLKVVRN